MNTDSRLRRLRNAPPQSAGERIAITPDDIMLFAAINRHGPLPTTYLHALVPDKNFNALQHRLTKLYNGSEHTPPLLSRPPQQFQSFNARYQPLVYDLTDLSKSLLVEAGTKIIKRTDAFVHRLMAACIGASLELGCRDARLRYISRAEVLAKRSTTLPINLNGKELIPDELFGLQYPDGTYRFFAVEIDRNTESIEGRNPVSNTFDRKLRGYLDLMQTRRYADHWGIPNLLMLTITTNEAHKANLLRHLDGLTHTVLKDRFLFKAEADFGTNWRIPSIMPDILLSPWARTGTSFRIDVP